jgi:hydroxymethylglutaryl-CoA lyase
MHSFFLLKKSSLLIEEWQGYHCFRTERKYFSLPLQLEVCDLLLTCNVTKRLLDIGVYEVSLGDTTGVGKPNQIAEILKYLIIDNKIDNNQLAVHFHNTNGYALQNIIVALQYGITTIDSSIAGIGGCPYARTDNGHSIGNVSTEAVVSLMNFLKIETGIDYNKLMKASSEIKNMISLNNIYHNI